MKMADIFGLLRMVHIVSFAAFFGMSIWVGLISGPVMFKNLTRHTFGSLQSKLFPIYFRLSTLLLSVAMVTFYVDHPYSQWRGMIKWQAVFLVITFLLMLANQLYISGAIIDTRFKKLRFEKQEGAGAVPGSVDAEVDKRLSNNPEYAALKRRHGMLHGASVLAELVAIVTSFLYLCCLSTNLWTI